MLDDFVLTLLEKTGLPLLYFGAFYFSLKKLTLHPNLERTLDIAGVFALTLAGILFTGKLVEYLVRNHISKTDTALGREQNINGLLVISKVLIWGLGVVFLLDNMGFQISAVVAGLGIGGIAVALAAQNILGDLFSFVSILFDRPFEVGDFIIVGEYMGTVEYVGIKTTRIRSLSGEQLVFSNKDLTGSRVRNYKRMEERRVVFKIGTTYGTSLDQVRAIPNIIRETIETLEDVRFDRSHFASFGDFSLIFETVYYVLGSDYALYMDIQQKINLALKEEFERRGIEFAFPTQTLHIGSLPRPIGATAYGENTRATTD
jgi:small-conductance mechanosensitive channel